MVCSSTARFASPPLGYLSIWIVVLTFIVPIPIAASGLTRIILHSMVLITDRIVVCVFIVIVILINVYSYSGMCLALLSQVIPHIMN